MTPTPGVAPNYSRITVGVLVVACLSGGPFVGFSRWVADLPLALDGWPFVYTVWAAGVLGAGMFVLDVLAPIAAQGVARSEMVLVAMAAPLALALWALMSAFWTESPGRTPLQALLMTLVVLSGIWFGYALTFRQQVTSLFVGLHALTVASVIVSASLDSARVGADDDWIGIFASPDLLSPVAGLGIVAAIGAVLLATSLSSKIAIGVLVVVDIVAVWQAASTTGLLSLCAAIAAFAVVLLVRGFNARGPTGGGLRAAGIVAVGSVLTAIPLSIQWFAGSSDEGSSLAQRADTWDFVFDAVEDRWIIGFGFQSFWGTEVEVQASGAETAGAVGSAQSSFVETLLYLGGIGLLLVLVVVIFGVGRVWWEALGGQSWAMGWWAAVATFVLVANFTESLIASHSIFWVLLVAPGFAAMRYSTALASTPEPPPNRQLPASTSFTYQ